ncbi:transposase, partial [Thermoanaerobacterium sp. R66]
IHSSGKVEIKESWIITTSKVTSVETLWKIIHKRWEIENNAFHQLKTEWHLNHCFLHSPEGVETVLMFIIIAFNLMQLYFFRCIRNFREKHMLQ